MKTFKMRSSRRRRRRSGGNEEAKPFLDNHEPKIKANSKSTIYIIIML